MRVISVKRLREFWEDPRNPEAESPVRTWCQVVKAADWTCFADVRRTYATADTVGNKVVFDVGGNMYRLIAVIDYEGHKLFVRYLLTHSDYDKGHWKKDPFGEDWKPRPRRTEAELRQSIMPAVSHSRVLAATPPHGGGVKTEGG